MNPYLLFSAIAASLGCFLFGFNTAVTAGATRSLTDAFHLSAGALGVTVSSALWGALIGTALALRIAGRIGRRAALRPLSVLFVISAAGSTLAWNWQSLAIFRLLGGIAIGGCCVIGTVYCAEIAPQALRRRFWCLPRFNVALGIALAYLSNHIVGLGNFGGAEWRWKLGVVAIFAYVLFFAFLIIPESPAWLLRQARPQTAREVLTNLGFGEVEALIQGMPPVATDQGIFPTRALFSGSCLASTRLAISIGLFSQLAGVSAVLYYLNDVLGRTGLTSAAISKYAVTIGFTGWVVALIGQTAMDRMGRKELLLAASCGSAMCLAAAALIFGQREGERLAPFLLTTFVTFSAISLYRLIWVYIRELFPDHLQIQATSLTLLVSLLASALVTGFFPPLWALSAAVPFAFFALATAVQFLVVLLVYPETKAASSEAFGQNREPSTVTPQP